MKNIKKITIILLFVVIASCSTDATYFDQLTKVKSITERIDCINKSITEIRKSEKKSTLITEGDDFLEYEYPVGESDSYKASYFFDEAGCFEVGLDTYFSTEVEAEQVKTEIKAVIENDTRFGAAKDSNSLLEWKSKDGAISIQLDYINQDRGMVSLTIFASK